MAKKLLTLKLGTRASNLALTQSRMIARMLKRRHKGLKIELVEISTTGDQVTDKPLQEFGGAGVFVKELERALLDKRIDFAVHSLKDMPTRQPRGLTLGAIVGREDARDCVITRSGKPLDNLPADALVGTGSTRRRAQLQEQYPHLKFAEIRGNVETRIRKVTEGQYAATILARAGLTRLGLMKHAAETLSFDVMLPAPGQGALGIECRKSDRVTLRVLKSLHQADVAACVDAERALLEALGGGCHLPLGALGQIEVQRSGRGAAAKKKKVLALSAVLGMPDGTHIVRANTFGAVKNAWPLGRKLAKEMLELGGREILKRLEG
jgi:hydroxymethylbilane synthase